MSRATVAAIFETMEWGPAPESDAPARAWLRRQPGGDGGPPRLGHFIGGAFVEGTAHLDTIDPATGAVLARLAHGDEATIDRAVAAARAALGPWQALSPHRRARHLYALARGLQKHSRLFAVLESLDNGKPIRETRDLDVPLAIRHFYHHAGWAQLAPRHFPDHVPLGVCGQIIPWNFPLLMLAWKIAPALAAGNTVVLKPAEFTSLTALAFAELCHETGLPPGVVNIVTGDGGTGSALVAHPGVDKIAFTGSTEVGRRIREATAGSGKALTLELGGNSPFIVFEDADLDSAVEGLVDAIWFNQGQVCCAGSRLLIQEGVHDTMIARLKARMETLRVGPPLDKAIDIGAIVAPVQLERIRGLVAQGVAEGATLHQPSWAVPREGCFFPPTLFTNVQPASTIAQVEIFGPVIAAMSFRTPAEAVALANNTPYGLAASVWSESVNLALDVAPKLRCGVVWINATNLFDAAAPFGGMKESGYGREGGAEGLLAYLRRKREAARRHRAAETPASQAAIPAAPDEGMITAVDRTAKLYIGGRQLRPDGGLSLAVPGAEGRLLGHVGAGNRKDVRNAVEAARKAEGWSRQTPHARAQILYYIAENLDARAEEFARRLQAMTGVPTDTATAEIEACVARLFAYAGWADKWDGAVREPPFRGAALVVKEPVGIIGIACPETPALLGLVSLMAPAIALGNRVVLVPSERHPLAATDFYQVLDTSDVPGGVVNIITGSKAALGLELARHDAVDAVWYFGDAAACTAVERASAGNLKQVWTDLGRGRDWLDGDDGEGPKFLGRASQVKTIWIPWGE